MLTEKTITPKLELIRRRYEQLRFEKLADVPVEMCETKEHFRGEPGPSTGVKWRAVKPGAGWGGNWMTGWFRGDARLPRAAAGRQVFVRAVTGGDTLFFVNGEPRGVFDFNHHAVMLTKHGVTGQKFHLSLEAYAGHGYPGCDNEERIPPVATGSLSFGGIELTVEREDVTAFVFDLLVLQQLRDILPENSLRRNTIIRELARVYAKVDALPQETGEAVWRPKLAAARKIMRPLLTAANSATTPWLGVVGHSHLDTAWLWPMAETWRKCARTFSSAVNLMDRYPEFLFVQSTSCYGDVVRREYPQLFKRIRKLVAAGRWEPNGGMWVEPDCNLPSGESFVRQFLIGQAATREMFGYRSDTLWLPDAFGFSAALPQIMRGCGIEFFCTTKIAWNDTTRFPYDTFQWKGIDGTAVLAHYIATHAVPDPKTLTHLWEWIQHKDVQDRRLFAFGYGDGGGGPTAEELELARRAKDLEGCPRARFTTVSRFMQQIRDELTELPEWAGELYLEYHRGTLTSVAGLKRGNRKAELALREAEWLAALASLRGAKYPAASLLALWKEMLTNQFHDILPGSSIPRVNDEAISALNHCIAGAEKMASDSLQRLVGRTSNSAASLVAVNSLSWDRTAALELRNVPAGMIPEDKTIQAQWITGIDASRRLAVSGLVLPALGAVAVPLTKRRAGERSVFKVSGNRVETPHALARFDRRGRIVSLVDKRAGREIVKRGGALNTFLLAEDVPLNYDNWDIDADHRRKMTADCRLIGREIAADGPVQLRIRSTYKLGARSKLTQDMVFHADSPRIDFETAVDWADKHRLLKVGFESDILADFARHEIQYGYIERPTHVNQWADRSRFEVCAHKWTDLSENNFGVALLNDCKYGIGVRAGELRLSLLKSGTHPDDRGDEGRHYFTYSLLPHACGFSVEAIVRPAYELNAAPICMPAGRTAAGFNGLLSVDAENVIVEVVKWAEKGKAFMVRLYEAGKTGGNVKLKFNVPVKSVSETDMLEEKPKSMRLKGNGVGFFIRPFEIKTLRCEV